ncbi:hypothetical protein BDB00DRAFT_378856 [Zychaea mexicana]|uniref:uncharacterized protein n=1 Tax=Zychaea mexicana TaxID=64656 RepID=UPI0022FF178E|nr:uncharacterized protein BDB00DRAFT_378856 [Zychaea mexicana]KAI9493389.1 hypothetical protein BDB00DRAFT_378856 [Zychaea mexicana]
MEDQVDLFLRDPLAWSSFWYLVLDHALYLGHVFHLSLLLRKPVLDLGLLICVKPVDLGLVFNLNCRAYLNQLQPGQDLQSNCRKHRRSRIELCSHACPTSTEACCARNCVLGRSVSSTVERGISVLLYPFLSMAHSLTASWILSLSLYHLAFFAFRPANCSSSSCITCRSSRVFKIIEVSADGSYSFPSCFAS